MSSTNGSTGLRTKRKRARAPGGGTARRCLRRDARARPSAPSRRNRQQAAREAGEQIDTGEAGPLAVGREQLLGVRGVTPATGEGRAELDQTEVADEAAVETAQSFQEDDADRPRPKTTLPLEPRGDRRGVDRREPLEVDCATEADDRSRLACGESQPLQLGRSESPESFDARRRTQAPCLFRHLPDHSPLDRASPP